MSVCGRLHYVAGIQGGSRYYMNMDHLIKLENDLPSDIMGDCLLVVELLK